MTNHDQATAAVADFKNAPRRVSDMAPRIDRLPPHVIEAEQGVIGSVLLSPNDCIDECVQAGMSKDWFYDLRHRELWGTITSLHEFKIPIDMVTLAENLKQRNLLDGIGGLGYLSRLPDMVPSAANLMYYVEMVREKFKLRSLLHTCIDIASRVYDYEGGLDDLLSQAEQAVLAINATTKTNDAKPYSEIVDRAMFKIEKLIEGDATFIGLPTGLKGIDDKILGMAGGEMIVVGARPSVGKTSLAMQIAQTVAKRGHPSGVFSMEMPDDSLAMRAIAGKSQINIRKFAKVLDLERDVKKIMEAASELKKLPVFVDDTPALSTQQFRSKARRMVSQHGVKLLVIDYLQLMKGCGRKFSNRQDEVAFISGEIKAAARELQIPVIVLSQLKRFEGNKKNQRPSMDDLRESGAIEQDADVVMLLYLGEDGDDVDEKEIVAVKVYVAKQRNGEKGDAELQFIRSRTIFRDPPIEEPQRVEQQPTMV